MMHGQKNINQPSISFTAVNPASICRHALRQTILLGAVVVSNSVLIASYRKWRRDPSRRAPRDLIIGKKLRNLKKKSLPCFFFYL
jgi:hypothetical protein